MQDQSVVKKKRPKLLSPRRGTVVEISGVSVKIVARIAINYLAKRGLITGLMTGTGIALSKISAIAISNYLYDAFPQNLPGLEKKKFILFNGEKIYLNQCDPNLQYLAQALTNPDLSFQEKKAIVEKIFTKYLDLRTPYKIITFIFCMVFLLYILSTQNQSSFYLLMKNLIEAIREGRVSKPVDRTIIRKLKRKGIIVDPELIDVAT